MTMPSTESDDPVARFIAAYLESVEEGGPTPELAPLSPSERAEAQALLSELLLDADVDVGIPPIEESEFAAARGIVRPSPPVTIHGDALQHARLAAQLSVEEVAHRMTALGVTAGRARIEELEEAGSTLLSAREARRLAASVGVRLEVIEASAEPWPAADRAQLAAIDPDEAPMEMAGHLAYMLAAGFFGGVLRCRGQARDLDSLTFRRAAGTLLHGDWSHLHAAVLVTAAPPHQVLVVDPFDCMPRFAAPSGEIGYGAVPPAEDLRSAVAHYAGRFGIEWHDPVPFFSEPAGPGWSGLLDVRFVRAASDAARSSVNRFAILKREGCRAGLAAVDRAGEDDLERLAADLASASDEDAARRIGEMVVPA